MAQHDHDPSIAPFPLVGSGTAWLPAAAPLRGYHVSVAGWRLMIHGDVFVQFVRDFGTRADYQLGSVNWIMGEAARPLAGGTIGARVMASAEALTVTERGYPQLLQVAQCYRGGTLSDRMHPHELVSEATVTYERPVIGSHHAQDFTHTSFGVATLGVFTRHVRLEGSVFNGTHPDAVRTNFDYAGARFNSYAVRLTVNPTAQWSGPSALRAIDHQHSASNR